MDHAQGVPSDLAGYLGLTQGPWLQLVMKFSY
jgi:hypothetical protein